MGQAAKVVATDHSVVPTPEELYERARGIMPWLAERAQGLADAGCVSEEVIAEIKRLGLVRILQPKRWGGYEMSPGVFYEVQTLLAEGDMAVGWVYGVVGVHNWHIALFDERVARDVWGEDDSTLVASTYMPVGKIEEVEGGYKLSGRWKFSSGCDNARWILLGAMLPDGAGGVEPGTLLVPRSDLQIVDDSWQVGGLRGTGSKDIVVEGAFVPTYRTHSHKAGFLCKSPGNESHTAPLYRMPFGQVFIRAVNGASIGALKAFANAVADYAAKRVSPFGGKTSDSPAAQLAIAEALSAVSEMKAVLHRNFASLEAYANRGETPPTGDRLLFKYQAAQTATRGADLAAKLYRVVGGMGLFTSAPFSRMFDDILAARQHQFNQDFAYAANYGAVTMGRENADYFI